MIQTEHFYTKLCDLGIDFFTGVPDSLLKDFGNCVYEKRTQNEHVIAANEGNAVALAAGAYIATGKLPLVYLQNSGLGNTVNPLLSMADEHLYAIPMLILVGWRGQDGVGDAEQHLQQGPATPKIIEAINYPQIVLSKDEAQAFAQLEQVVQELQANPQPYFVVIEADSFGKYALNKKSVPAGEMSREEALRIIAESLPAKHFVVSTTGKTSREWFEVREQLQQSHARDFLTVGSMGHTSSIALGMALRSNKDIVCIDGDGSMLMHMGSMAIAGSVSLSNFRYILVNNFSHESVGGLPTSLGHVDFEAFFKSLGFKSYTMADNTVDLRQKIKEWQSSCCAVLEVRVKQGSRADLARPNKKAKALASMLRQEFDTH